MSLIRQRAGFRKSLLVQAVAAPTGNNRLVTSKGFNNNIIPTNRNSGSALRLSISDTKTLLQQLVSPPILPNIPVETKHNEVTLGAEALTLVGLSTAVAFICSIDRAAMSVAILPMSETFNWDNSVKGSISAAFFVGYMVTNVCGGFLANKYSAKNTLAVGVAVWSLFTVATPFAAGLDASSGNLYGLLAVRGAMGVGEGVAYPAIQTLTRRWIPSEARSRALSLIYSGHQLGTIASYLAAPALIAAFNWPIVFWLFGSLGFFWLLGWMPLVRDHPASHDEHSALPGKEAESDTPAASLQLKDVPWVEFIKNPAFWSIVAAQVSIGVGSCLSFSWLPTFYNDRYAVDIATSTSYTVIPFVVTALATNSSGWIADSMVNNKVLDKTSTRKLMQAVASFGPAACLLKLAADAGGDGHGTVNDAAVAVTAWLALCGFSAAGYGSNHQDISRKHAGIIFGLSNGLASIAGSASIYATGKVLNATHDWSLIFQAAAGIYIAGAVIYLKWASSEEQFEK